MRPFHEYEVWKLGHEIVLDVYRLTSTFPREELYGLTSQMRRAAYSIPMNIVEGSSKSDDEFHQDLNVSLGSAGEVEYQLFLSRDLGYLTPEDYARIDEKVKREKRMLVAFMKALRPRATTAGLARQGPARRPSRLAPTASGQRPMASAEQPR